MAIGSPAWQLEIGSRGICEVFISPGSHGQAIGHSFSSGNWFRADDAAESKPRDFALVPHSTRYQQAVLIKEIVP